MKTALRILCLVVSTWLVFPPTTAAQPPGPPKVPIDAGALDVVVKKDTKEKLKGRIRFATTDSINLKPEKKLAILLSTDDYEIEFWNGVTNAAEILASGKKDFDELDEFVTQIRFSESKAGSATTRITTVKRAASALLERIRVVNAGEIDNFPPVQNLNRDDIAALNNLSQQKRTLDELDSRIRMAVASRAEVNRLRRKLRLLELAMRGRRFRDAYGECLRLSGELGRKEDKSPVEDEFRLASETLKDYCAKLEKTEPFIEKLPSVTQLPTALDDVKRVLPELAEPRGVRILGSAILLQLVAIHKEHVTMNVNLTRMSTLLIPVQTAGQSWKKLQTNASGGSIESLAEFDKQITQLDADLKKIRDALEPKSKQEIEAAVLNEISKLQREIVLNRDLLSFRVELPVVTKQVRDSRGITDEAQARKLASVLDTRHKELSRYLKLTPIQGEDRRKLDFTLASLRSASARLRGSAMQVIIESAETVLSSIQKEQAGLLTDLTDNVDPLKELQSLKVSLGSARKEFEERCTKEKQLSNSAQALLKAFSSTDSGLDLGLHLLGVRSQYLQPFSRDATREELESAEGRLSRSTGVIAGLTDLPDELSEIHRTTELLLRKRGSELQSLRIQIDADRVAAEIEKSLDEVESSLTAKQTTTAAVKLFDSQLAIRSFGDQVNAESVLAKDQNRQDQMSRFSETIERLTTGLIQQRRQKRAVAGWLQLPDENATLVVPTIQNRWMVVEILIGMERFREARQAVEALAEGERDPYSRSRISESLGRLDLKEARHQEAAGQTPSAQSRLFRLISAEESSIIERSARSALHGLNQRVSQKTDVAGNATRAMGAATFFLAVIFAGVFVVRREFTRSRMKRAQVQLRSFRKAEKRNALVAVRRSRERTALLLASLPAENNETRDLFADLKTGQLKFPTHVSETMSPTESMVPAQPDPDHGDIVAAVITADVQPTESEVAEVVQWLNSERARKRNARKLRTHAVAWLRRVLQPQEHEQSDQLNWKLKYTIDCREEGTRRDPWPLLFELRLRVMLRQWQGALAVAPNIPLKGCHQAVVSEVVSMVTRCHVELEQWDEAEMCVREFLKSKSGASKELHYWLSVAIARQATQSGSRLNSESLDALLNTLSGMPGNRKIG